jgi:hypothetical protein
MLPADTSVVVGGSAGRTVDGAERSGPTDGGPAQLRAARGAARRRSGGKLAVPDEVEQAKTRVE